MPAHTQMHYLDSMLQSWQSSNTVYITLYLHLETWGPLDQPYLCAPTQDNTENCVNKVKWNDKRFTHVSQNLEKFKQKHNNNNIEEDLEPLPLKFSY